MMTSDFILVPLEPPSCQDPTYISTSAINNRHNVTFHSLGQSQENVLAITLSPVWERCPHSESFLFSHEMLTNLDFPVQDSTKHR